MAIAALVLLAAARPARAQIAPSGPRWPGPLSGPALTGDGPAARADDPAVAAPGPGWAWSLPGLEIGLGLDPVSIGDLGDAPDPVSRALRERWMQNVEARGEERGDASARVGWGAVARAGWVLHASSAAWTRVRLDPDAAELLLFGNAGRTGQPRPLAPDGQVDAAVLSRFTLGSARRIAAPWPGRVTVGAAAAVTIGHGVWVGRDAGSLGTADPPTLSLRFPVLERRLTGRAGWGSALHLGAAWENGAWSAGLTAQNVLERFRWSRDGMTVRAGEAVLGPDPPDVDNTPRPASEAPAALLAALDSLRPRPQVALAAARRFDGGVRVAAELRTRARGGLASGARTSATLAAEWSPRPTVPLQAAAELGRGLALGLAAQPKLGRWVVRLGGGFGLVGARRDVSASLGAWRSASAP